jgi:hypothetical protein
MQQQGEAGRGLPIFLPSVGRRFREWKTPVAKLEGKSLSKDFERHNIEQDSDCNNIVAAAPELRRRMLPRAVDVRLKFFIESCGKVRGVVGVLCFAAAQGGTVGECLFLDLANLANHCECWVTVNVQRPASPSSPHSHDNTVHSTTKHDHPASSVANYRYLT